MHRITATNWPDFAKEKVHRRGIDLEEVEEAVFSDTKEKKREGDRILIRSQSLAGRYLFVVAVPVAKHEVMIISAREMNDREKSNYRDRQNQ